MPVCAAQHAGFGGVSRAFNRAGLAACLLLIGSVGVQQAKAVGDTRTLSLHHVHTNEDLTITYKRNGRYDEEAMKKISHILRDWRRNEPTKMDPRLFDLVWEAYKQTGASGYINVVCGYRSPETNSMLRKRSSGVAKTPAPYSPVSK